MASAIGERTEFKVQENSTLEGRLATRLSL
jgi:hypothetical protein